MKTKFIIAFVFLFSFSSKTFAQPPAEYTDAITKLVSWFSDIDKVLTNISDREKLKKIYRQLGYASEDIDNIALGKLLLATEISKLTDAKPTTELEKLKPEIDQILIDITELLERLENIKSNLAQTDQANIEQIIQSIRSGFYNRKLYYLKDIQAFLYGKDISLSKIKNEAEQAKKIAESASKQIKIAKSK